MSSERALLRWVLGRFAAALSLTLVSAFALYLTASCGRELTVARAACDVIDVLVAERPDERLLRARSLIEEGRLEQALAELHDLADALAVIDGARARAGGTPAPATPLAGGSAELEPHASERQADVRALIALVERALEREAPAP